MPSLYSHGLESRLPLPGGGGGCDNPRGRWRVTIEYIDGEWFAAPQDEHGNVRGRKPISRDLAQTLSELGLTGGYTPDVLDRNRATWLQAFTTWAEEQHRVAVQRREKELLVARNALAEARRARTGSKSEEGR